MNYLSFYLREFFFPRGCGGCGNALLNPKDAYFGLCEDCRSFLNSSLANERHCELCGRSLITERGSCLSCREKQNSGEGNCNGRFIKQLTLFPYTGKFKRILGAYKFRNSLGIGNFFALCLKTAVQEFLPEPAGESVWVPVPPRPGKMRKQGWDQIEFLAGVLKKEYRLPVRRCLKRLPSRSQKELNKEERKTNLKGRIRCIKQPPQSAILFDDVMTTGATLNACAEALLEGGARNVYGVCLFYD